MKLNQREIFQGIKSLVLSYSIGNFLPMSPDVSTTHHRADRSGHPQVSEPTAKLSSAQPSPQPTKMKREASWQIATNLFISFKYAWAGISYAFQTQRNFRIHVVIGSAAIGLGVFLHLTAVEIAVIGLTIAAVMATELLNTAIESLVDMSMPQTYHELAKIAKDCAAGAVLVSSVAAILVAGCLLLPPLVALIQSHL